MVFILCNKTGFLCTSFSNTEFEAARHHLPSQNCILDAREIVKQRIYNFSFSVNRQWLTE